MIREYMADMQLELNRIEIRLEFSYRFIYRRLKRASTEIWGPTPKYMLKPDDKIEYKVHLSDEIRALAEEICADMTRGDPNTTWRESGMVDRGTWPEHHAKGQPSWDGIDIGDGAWSQHGAGVVHGTGEGGSDRMRGDRVGVGDVDEVIVQQTSY